MKGGNSAIYSDTKKPEKHCVKWNKSGSERKMSYDLTLHTSKINWTLMVKWWFSETWEICTYTWGRKWSKDVDYLIREKKLKRSSV